MKQFSQWIPALPILALLACGGAANPGISLTDMHLPSDLPARDTPTTDLGVDTSDAVDVLPEILADTSSDEAPVDPGPDTSAVPKIAVLPTSMDFGFAARAIATQRTLTVQNTGSAPLVVSSVTLPEDSSGEFTADATAVLAGPIAPGESAAIALSVMNVTADTGMMSGLLRIASNDPANPALDVALTAQRSAVPACSFELVPSTLNFGTVPEGYSKDWVLNLVNTGASSIQVDRLSVSACEDLGGTTTCSTTLGDSPWWTLVLAPEAASVVTSGSQTRLRLRLDVPPAGSATLPNLPGRTAITLSCPAGSPGAETFTWPSDCAPASSCPPNLGVVVGTPSLVADPVAVQFTDTQQGCETATTRVRFKNTGNTAVTMTSVALDPACPNLAAFTLAAPSPLPSVIAAGAWLDAFVGFVPNSMGASKCALRIDFAAPAAQTLLVTLAGTSTSDGSRTEHFVQAARKADILLVLDATGSMQDGTLDRIVGSASALMKAATQAGTDARLGVIGIGTASSCPSAANLRGTPRFLDPNTIGSLGATVTAMSADTACDASAMETGLEAARLALSAPRTDDEGQSCTLDAFCATGHTCVDGVCGGPNRGFLRPDASLDVVVVTDEDDQSTDPVATYTAFLAGMKGTGGDALVRLHAMAGDLPDGCNNTWHFGAAGTRYAQAVKATGGLFTSICTGNFDTAFAAIGSLPYVPRTLFPLSGKPWQDSLKVTVDGVVCTGGWTSQAATPAIVFDTTGACLPAPGSEVVVTYFEACP